VKETKDYELLMERARSRGFADARLLQHYGIVVWDYLRDIKDDPEESGLSGDFSEVVCMATGWTFELDPPEAFDEIDLPGTYRRIASSPDYLSETLLIVSECFRAYILNDVA